VVIETSAGNTAAFTRRMIGKMVSIDLSDISFL